MRSKLYHALFICINFVGITSVCIASQSIGSFQSQSNFILQNNDLRSSTINKSFASGSKLTAHSLLLGHNTIIYGAGLSAQVSFSNDEGLARVILIDAQGKEYLMYETYSLFEDAHVLSLEKVAYETKLLDGVIPSSLRIELLDASIILNTLDFAATHEFQSLDMVRTHRDLLLKDLEQETIQKINVQIKKKGLLWTAGRTSLSNKTYAEKKALFTESSDCLPNLQGFEYYAGGVLETPAFRAMKRKNAIPESDRMSALVDTFDWRSRHGANNRYSAYYDNDSLGGGWITGLRHQSQPQSCGSCWTFATIAAAEAVANLYYNRHVNLDLSEQYLMTCSCAEACIVPPDKPCSGGYSMNAARWLCEHGVTNEENFPYLASNHYACGDSALNPKEHFSFQQTVGLFTVPSVDSLKKMLIHYGPLAVNSYEMWHVMCLVGYTKEASTGDNIWIFKNSYGTTSGNKGYSYYKMALSDMRFVNGFVPPAKSKIYTADSILCADYDKDGFYNWGIGPKPATCPKSSPNEEDCDDSDKNLGPMLPDASCKKMSIGTAFHPVAHSNVKYNYACNPVNKSVTIKLQTTNTAQITIAIYDISGKLVKTLPLIQESATSVRASWNGFDAHEGSIRNGTYLCRITNHSQESSSYAAFKFIVSW